MDKAKWMALAERCEKATGPDRELDCAIWGAAKKHINPDALLESFRRELSIKTIICAYTTSLDAITELIERKLPGHGHGYTLHDPAEKQAVAHVANEDDDVFGTSAATPALALCAAFCRAMAERAAE